MNKSGSPILANFNLSQRVEISGERDFPSAYISNHEMCEPELWNIECNVYIPSTEWIQLEWAKVVHQAHSQ